MVFLFLISQGIFFGHCHFCQLEKFLFFHYGKHICKYKKFEKKFHVFFHFGKISVFNQRQHFCYSAVLCPMVHTGKLHYVFFNQQFFFLISREQRCWAFARLWPSRRGPTGGVRAGGVSDRTEAFGRRCGNASRPDVQWISGPRIFRPAAFLFPVHEKKKRFQQKNTLVLKSNPHEREREREPGTGMTQRRRGSSPAPAPPPPPHPHDTMETQLLGIKRLGSRVMENWRLAAGVTRAEGVTRLNYNDLFERTRICETASEKVFPGLNDRLIASNRIGERTQAYTAHVVRIAFPSHSASLYMASLSLSQLRLPLTNTQCTHTQTNPTSSSRVNKQ